MYKFGYDVVLLWNLHFRLDLHSIFVPFNTLTTEVMIIQTLLCNCVLIISFIIKKGLTSLVCYHQAIPFDKSVKGFMAADEIT